ncbi:MAG: thiolase family protein [Deltaproteobacteria bacterium]|nr:thiolase family protein [Deltaproteobacteria bacterium]
MRDVAVVGVGMTKFGKFLERSNKDLVREAVEDALADAGIKGNELEAAYVGNSMAGILTGQEAIRGQVTLAPLGIDTIPIVNVENACARSSTAIHLAWLAVASGQYDCVLAVGFEKLFHADKAMSFKALSAAMDVESGIDFLTDFSARCGNDPMIGEGAGINRSIFMDMYSYYARAYMKECGLTQEHFAKIAVKSHKIAALNPRSQYRREVTLGEVLASGDVVFPLTRMMCAPMGDGAAAAVLCSKPVAARLTTSPIWVAGSTLGSGSLRGDGDFVTAAIAPKAYAAAGIGPGEIDVVEVHDTTSPAEIVFLIQLGLCPPGNAARWIEEGQTGLEGAMPTNPSGGLQSKGHPVGATGTAQIFEIVNQLKGRSGPRQVKDPKVGMTQNGGGVLGPGAAAMAIHIFKR